MKRNQKGFTLIEIIAVLVILGILAAIAIPKYFDLQDNARNKAVDGALAEGVGRINAWFGKQALAGQAVNDILYTTTTLGTDAGDFTLNYTGGGTTGAPRTITVTATGVASSLSGVTGTKTLIAPQ